MSPPPRQPSNLPASIHARLLRLAKQSDANFNVVLVRFATERLLYRLSRSPHADRFVLKGAWLFYVWGLERRVTRDLDLLGFGNASPAAMEEVFREVLGSPVEADGIEFDHAELQVAKMREGAAYPGVRVRIVARLGNARIPFQVDVGFGDIVVDPPARRELPTLLDLPAPELSVYPVEAVVAEKIEAMGKRPLFPGGRLVGGMRGSACGAALVLSRLALGALACRRRITRWRPVCGGRRRFALDCIREELSERTDVASRACRVQGGHVWIPPLHTDDGPRIAS